MSSGNAHHAVTVLTAIGLAGSMYLAGQPWPETAALAGGCLAGVLITPDLDVQNPVHANSVAWRIGWPFGIAWRVIWWPYARVIPKHRHWMSHFPLVGTLGRALYLYGAAWLILAVTRRLLPGIEASQLPAIWPIHPLAGLALLGLALSDAWHWVFDYVRWPVRRRDTRRGYG